MHSVIPSATEELTWQPSSQYALNPLYSLGLWDAVIFIPDTQPRCLIINWAGQECEKRGIASKTRIKLEVMIEDLGMLIIEKNKHRPVLTEITISFKKDIKVVMRDGGVLYDVTDPDAALSFRSMFVSGLLKNGSRSTYLFTQNYNRHVFTLEK